MKRLFDIVASLAGLVVLAPLLLATAVLVKLTSKGPVIFAQERIGRGFRPFRILKFRSMVQDAHQQGSGDNVGWRPENHARGLVDSQDEGR